MRNAQHYRDMLARNPDASIGFSLAARMVYASRHGACEDEDCGTDEWREIARDLKRRYGENLTVDEVRAEMKPGRRGENRIYTYLFDGEVELAKRLAAAEGLSLSSWIRMLILREARPTENKPSANDTEGRR